MSNLTCPRCGTVSPTEFMAQINHFQMVNRDVCTSQWLALNQLEYQLNHPSDLLTLAERQERVRELNCERQARERGLM